VRKKIKDWIVDIAEIFKNPKNVGI
jgi:hypothetical protein